MPNESQLYAMISTLDDGDLLDLWMCYKNELAEYRFLKSTESAGNKVKHVEKVLPIQGVGEIYIESLFISDRFLFPNDSIAHLNYNGMPMNFNYDMSVSIDLNLLKYMSNLIEGYQNETSYVAFHAIRYLISNGINYDFNLFYWENYDRMSHQNVYGSKNFLNNMRAAEIIKDLDEDYFLRRGEVRARCSEKVVLERVDAAIASQNNILKHSPEFYSSLWKLTYLSMLVTISLKNSKNRGKEDILGNLIEFYDRELGIMLLRDLFYSKYFLENPNSSFFSFIQPKNPKFFRKLKGLAWDLHIFRVLERFSAYSHQSDFMIPYVMTYDKRYSDMLKVFRLQSLFYKKGMAPLASPESSIQSYLSGNSDWEKYFSFERHMQRVGNYNDDKDFDALITKYEILVANLLKIPVT